MEAVSALPASNSPFYKSQTVASIFYSVIFLIVSSVLLGISISIAFNERFTFSCKGVTQDYRKALCLEAYNNGPNDLQSWLYLTTFIGPLMIIVSMIILMLRKKYTLQKNNCTVHLHHLYFLKVSLRFLFHVLVCLALYIKLSIYRIGQLTLEGSYSCLIGSSTISCIDGKAKSKSYENIVCCLLHGFLVVFSLLELVYYSYKWRLSEEARNRQSSESTQCGECSYFIKTFNVFADCGNSSQNGTSGENSHLLPNSVANMPRTSVHASYGATVNIGDIGCVSTNQNRNCTEEEIERKQKAEIDEIKKKYRQKHKMHKIHRVDKNNRIVLEEVDINKFAVNLKITRELPTIDNFRDETRRHFAHIQGMRDDDIEISDLSDDETRVTFIRGIAGMGKSVLAKQLTYGWANGDIYQNFKMCVMFECRDLNYFKDHEGAKLEKHETLGEFLKGKVSYDLGDGEGVLIIVDGLDELFDITEKDSIIFDLLSINGKYGMAKLIITGRPHVEDKLSVNYDIGGLYKVEINGLSEDQIDEYIEKFTSRRDHKVNINEARNSSKGYLPIMNVPQFLNTFCCVAILMKGEAVFNTTELYCWTVFLLLKQHADKNAASRQRASDIFHEFSEALYALSEICHHLLAENKIVFEGDMKVLLGDLGKDKEFVQSLFVDVSDNITEKYQFKHLSLMEFLSAIYICKKDRKNLMKIIKDNLEKGFIEVVSFVCRLLSGVSYGGIIKQMLKNVVKLEGEVNEKQLLGDVIVLLNDCGLHWTTKLSRSFEIITFFLNKNFGDKDFIKSIIGMCHGYNFESDEITTDNICKICRHLESCGWKEDDIRMAFADVMFGRIRVSKVEQLDMVAIKERFCIGSDGIELHGMKTTLNAIRRKFVGGGENGYCGLVVLASCELQDEVNECSWNDQQLEGLNISDCQLKMVSSFVNACNWGMSCKWFGLYGMDINIDWWERMVEMIEERRWKGDLKVWRLEIRYCTTRMSHQMEVRLMNCGVKLSIAHNGMKTEMPVQTKLPSPLTSPAVDLPPSTTKPPSPLTSPSTIDLPPSTDSPSISEVTDTDQGLPGSTISTSLCMTSPHADVHITVDHSTESPSIYETTGTVQALPGSTIRPFQSESDHNAREEEELQLAMALSLSTAQVDQQMRPLQSGSDLNAEEEEELRLAIALSLSTAEVDQQQSPSSSETSDHRHVLPPSTLPSGTPYHGMRTPSESPTASTSSSPPSAEGPSSQVSILDPQMASLPSSLSSLCDDYQDGARRTTLRCIVT